MNDTWAAVLAISTALMAIVQLSLLAGAIVATRRLTETSGRVLAAVEATQRHLETLGAEVKEHVDGVAERVNAVAADVRGVTTRVHQMATSVSVGVQHVEESVRHAGQRVASTIDQVPPSVKQGIPAGLAILAALRTVQQVRSRLRAS
jgi:uncharacterized protein YoxC